MRLFLAHEGGADNDLNMIRLDGFVVGRALAWELVKIFRVARFSGAKRHYRRRAIVAGLENKL